MKKILIADDSLFLRKMLKDILSKDYELVEADTGKTTLQQLKKEKPDLIILDIVMPKGEEEGIRVLKEIIKTNPETPIVMITAVGQDTITGGCKGLGAKDYIAKPFDNEQVLEPVKNL